MLKRTVGAAVFLAAVGLTGASGLEGQTWQTLEMECDEWSGDGARLCERRVTTFPSAGSLEVGGGSNGTIAVRSWDRDEVEVVATVRARAPSPERAREILGEVELRADPTAIEADGPENRRREQWGVSWEIRVPRRVDLDLRTTNGGILVEDVAGDLDVGTRNGGIRLERISGSANARTTNGRIHLALSGDRWTGSAIDLHTTNGGITLEVPEGFDAELDARTTNGSIEVDFPVTVEGTIGRRLRTTLGDGGPTVRLRTTNATVRILRR